MSAADFGGIFKRPFAEQLAFWRQKLGNQVPTARWDDLWKSQHDRAFMVAGAMKADLLADLAAAVDRAIADGVGIGQFRKDFDAIVAKHGWAYTGERNWRTRVIYRTNAATSYAAGRLAQLRAGGFKLWMYRHGGSLDPRPQHLAWDGLVLPPDHPFWQTHAPPNGWGCSCRIVGVRSKDVARRLGGDPDKTLPDGWDAIDPRTGEPRGIDRGWGYQPGAGSIADELEDQLERRPRPEPLQADLASVIDQVQNAPQTLDEFIAFGERITSTLPSLAISASRFRAALLERLSREVGTSTPAKVTARTPAGKLIQEASLRFPDSWTTVADAAGPLKVRQDLRGRAYAYTHDGPRTEVRLPLFGIIRGIKPGDGYITVGTRFATAVHEYAHRLQATLPGLDALFQQIHRRRTSGDPLRSLAQLTGHRGYGRDEWTREDSYLDPYQGKEYARGGALEVMSMAFEWLLGGNGGAREDWELQRFAQGDPEMFRLAIGLLFGWRP